LFYNFFVNSTSLLNHLFKKLIETYEYNYSRYYRSWSLCSRFVLSNKVLETMVDTNDEWITSRTGIKERRILKEEGKGTSLFSIKAAQDLIKKANVNPAEIDLVIVATQLQICQLLQLLFL
jgi:hypothetical protein